MSPRRAAALDDAGDVGRLYEAAGLEMPKPDKPRRRKKAES